MTAVIVLFLATLLMSLCMCVAGISEDGSAPLGVISLLLSAVSGGIITGGCKRKNGFFWGAVEGFILFLIILIVAVISGNTDNGQLVLKLLLCVIGSMAGGIIGVNLPVD